MRASLIHFAVFFLTAAAATSSAHAQQSVVGLWGFYDCEIAQEIEFQGYTLAAFTNDGVLEILPQEISPIEGSSWLFVRTDEDDDAPSLMRLEDDVLVQAWPRAEPSTSEDIAALHKALASGELEPEASPGDFQIHRGTPCAGLPFPHSFLFGETLSILRDLDLAVWQCRSDGADCLSKVFSVADVSANGALSIAEISRVIRASLVIGMTVDTDGRSRNDVRTAVNATGIAPLAAATFLYSFDYDTSGDLSFDELFSERLPAHFEGFDTVDLSIEDWVDAISAGARAFAQASSAFQLRQ
ncbi:MAG: hypothetical protein AAGI09_08810 [Pseudomonadota bacterium]